jgi:hypothetical protein
MLWPTTTSIRAEANPAIKLLAFGCSDGRYRNPDPAECSGITKMSYFPGGSPEDLGTPPCGGGGGGGPSIVTLQPSRTEEVFSKMPRVESYRVSPGRSRNASGTPWAVVKSVREP